MDYELLPNLRNLADENTNFSATEGVGGFNSPIGTTWTMGAMFASSSGLPFMFPIDGNLEGNNYQFAEKIITLGDVLKGKGYNLEFLCGSEAEFAGRKGFYENHGNYEIFDLNTALEKKLIDEKVWWGFDDKHLYDIAKDEIKDLASKNDPFCLTMITVDTHHVGGYICDLCRNDYDIQYANVIACADRQIYDFVSWIKEQDFFENTTVVIIGDHPTMDATLIDSNLEESETTVYRNNNNIDNTENRFVYNCFINSRKSCTNTKNRRFNTLDLFPTIISSIGFDIEGNHLGLGVDMFSGEQTLQEKTSFAYLNEELSKYSQYCEDNFY